MPIDSIGIADLRYDISFTRCRHVFRHLTANQQKTETVYAYKITVLVGGTGRPDFPKIWTDPCILLSGKAEMDILVQILQTAPNRKQLKKNFQWLPPTSKGRRGKGREGPPVFDNFVAPLVFMPNK